MLDDESRWLQKGNLKQTFRDQETGSEHAYFRAKAAKAEDEALGSVLQSLKSYYPANLLK